MLPLGSTYPRAGVGAGARRAWTTAGVFAVLLTAICPLAAQSTNGTITGRVTDSQGAVVPGVIVTVSSPSLQGNRTAATSENGDYLVPLLPPGTYQVAFELS